jgi:hypothetical protein
MSHVRLAPTLEIIQFILERNGAARPPSARHIILEVGSNFLQFRQELVFVTKRTECPTTQNIRINKAIEKRSQIRNYVSTPTLFRNSRAKGSTTFDASPR